MMMKMIHIDDVEDHCWWQGRGGESLMMEEEEEEEEEEDVIELIDWCCKGEGRG